MSRPNPNGSAKILKIHFAGNFLDAFFKGTAPCAQVTRLGNEILTGGSHVDDSRTVDKVSVDLHRDSIFLPARRIILRVNVFVHNQKQDVAVAALRREINQILLVRLVLANVVALHHENLIAFLNVAARLELRISFLAEILPNDFVIVVRLKFRAADNHNLVAAVVGTRRRTDRSRAQH